MMKQLSLVTLLGVVACSTSQGDGKAVEQNDLGITSITIEHGDVNGERLLTVRGLDQNEQQIAIARLRTGTVMYGADLPEAPNAGTELTVNVGDTTQTFVSPDRVAHTLPTPASTTLATFVHLRDVAGALESEAGIEFTPPSSGETAFSAGACNGANFPTTKGSPSQCCQDGLQIWHKVPSGGSVNTLANRTVLASGGVCRDSGGNTGCVDSACTYGPCGAAIVTVPGSNTTAAAVFHPTGFPTQCGRDSNGNVAGGGVEAPEAYSSQSLYGGVTASCPGYTSCSSSGSPGVHVTLAAYCDGSGGAGTVRHGTDSVSCTGSATNFSTVWYPYNTPNSISATASHGFFVNWLGDCSGTGVCSLTATADGLLAEAWFSNCQNGC